MTNLDERTEKLKAWIAALRSGEYTQGRRYLVQHGENGTLCYCCLGVACEIAGLERVEGEVTGVMAYRWQVSDDKGRVYDSGLEASMLPPQLDKEHAYPKILSVSPTLSVVAANDRGVLNFREIADVLESVYLGDGTVAEKILTAMYERAEDLVLDTVQIKWMRDGFEVLKRDFAVGTV